ncbi:NUDIX hydrolase [Methylococcus sp. ANG]|uniref:NUDIX hydrolase n=1 Tax=Methylococcus sp. ANG TaxID=3231903 RepID=UPI003459A42F
MKYCSQCAAPLRLGIPAGDDRPRHICDACGTIHYRNPKVIAGCIPVWNGQVLLCRRAIEPRHGFWTLPAGFMELEETLEQAAERESYEEATARVRIDSLYTLFSLPHLSQVYAFFRAELLSPDVAAGLESLETRLFEENEIPWDQLAFETVHRSLTLFFEDRRSGAFGLHVETLGPDHRRIRN